jgi:hypothetical protein
MCDAGNAVGPLVTRAQEVGTVEGSLYERLGGVEAITAVVRAFDDRAGKDGRINQKFARTNLDDAFMEDLVAVLDDFKVGKAEQDEFLSLLRPMRADIVEVDSSQVATPLPSAFAPAPPL